MYIPDSYNPLEKAFYRPIDAAIRWCNLMNHEAQILGAIWDYPAQLSAAFPQWPCLYVNTEKIFDAIRNHEIPFGFFGVTAPPKTPIDYRLVTIRHTDLKWWVLHHHPDQRPEFLFGKPATEQTQINVTTYLTLQADRDALKIRLEANESAHRTLLDELKALGVDQENLSSLVVVQSEVSERSQIVFHHIIGALLETMLGSSPAGRPNSVFDSQASIVNSIIAHYEGVLGLSKRTLDEKFAAARRSISQF